MLWTSSSSKKLSSQTRYTHIHTPKWLNKNSPTSQHRSILSLREQRDLNISLLISEKWEQHPFMSNYLMKLILLVPSTNLLTLKDELDVSFYLVSPHNFHNQINTLLLQGQVLQTSKDASKIKNLLRLYSISNTQGTFSKPTLRLIILEQQNKISSYGRMIFFEAKYTQTKFQGTNKRGSLEKTDFQF